MFKLILWLIARYNKRGKSVSQIEVLTPVIFSAKQTSKIDTTLYESDKDKEFLQNIINEKKYDLRQELITQLYKSSFIHEDVEIQEQKIIIKLQIKAFSYEKR